MREIPLTEVKGVSRKYKSRSAEEQLSPAYSSLPESAPSSSAGFSVLDAPRAAAPFPSDPNPRKHEGRSTLLCYSPQARWGVSTDRQDGMPDSPSQEAEHRKGRAQPPGPTPSLLQGLRLVLRFLFCWDTEEAAEVGARE